MQPSFLGNNHLHEDTDTLACRREAFPINTDQWDIENDIHSLIANITLGPTVPVIIFSCIEVN